MDKTTKKSSYGVLTEQGFPVGQFGFEPLNEQDETKIKKTTTEDKK